MVDIFSLLKKKFTHYTSVPDFYIVHLYFLTTVRFHYVEKNMLTSYKKYIFFGFTEYKQTK